MVNLPVVIKRKFANVAKVKDVGQKIETCMSIFGNDMDRSSHYNTREELAIKSDSTHQNLFEIDRSIYGCLACLPGVTDISKMKVIYKLLGNSWILNPDFHVTTPILPMEYERKIIDYLLSTLPANRMFNTFINFIDLKINNARTRKTVLPFILNSPNLAWWSVKYRSKLKKSLSHCWGKKMTSVICEIMESPVWSSKEEDIILTNIRKHIVDSTINNISHIEECICFIFSLLPEASYTIPLFKTFFDAKTDFSKAKGLPKEIIEGIRSTYHPTIDKAKTLEVAKSSMTSKEKRLVQNQAVKSGVEIEWDPNTQPLVELFIYGFKMGFTHEIRSAITWKAKKAASLLPFNYNCVGLLLDDSFSMSGSEDQKLKALAIAYATIEMLSYIGTDVSMWTTSGRDFHYENKPIGHSNLAHPLIRVLRVDRVDAIFVVSDGYENASEGRFGEVLKIARDKCKISVPVYHFNPVAAAESKIALRRLAEDVVPTPVTNPEKMGLTLFKTMLTSDPKAGIIELFKIVLPELEKTKELYARKIPTALTQGGE